MTMMPGGLGGRERGAPRWPHTGALLVGGEIRAGRLSARSFLESLSSRLVEAPADAAPCFPSLSMPAELRDAHLAHRLTCAGEGGPP